MSSLRDSDERPDRYGRVHGILALLSGRARRSSPQANTTSSTRGEAEMRIAELEQEVFELRARLGDLERERREAVDFLSPGLSNGRDLTSIVSGGGDLGSAVNRFVGDLHELLYVMDASGVQVTPNLVNPKYNDRISSEGLGRDRSDRPYFREVMRLGCPYSSGIYVSTASRHLCITVSVPLRDDRGTIVGVLAADINMNDLVKL